MKKIVLSAIAAIVLTVGVYWVALFLGASHTGAIAAAAAAAATAAIATIATAATAATATTVAAVAAAVAAAGTAAGIIVIASAAAGIIVIASAVVTAAAGITTVAALAKKAHIQFRWVLSFYTIEALAIVGAFTIPNRGWSIAASFGGISLLLFLWRIAPDTGRKSIPASEQNPV